MLSTEIRHPFIRLFIGCAVIRWSMEWPMEWIGIYWPCLAKLAIWRDLDLAHEKFLLSLTPVAHRDRGHHLSALVCLFADIIRLKPMKNIEPRANKIISFSSAKVGVFVYNMAAQN